MRKGHLKLDGHCPLAPLRSEPLGIDHGDREQAGILDVLIAYSEKIRNIQSRATACIESINSFNLPRGAAMLRLHMRGNPPPIPEWEEALNSLGATETGPAPKQYNGLPGADAAKRCGEEGILAQGGR